MSNSSDNTKILAALDIEQKTRRMAYQVLEQNYNAKDIIVVGIKAGGYKFAQRLVDCMAQVPNVKVKLHLHSLSLDKEKPAKDNIKYDFDEAFIKDKTVLVVDDVANSGKTLAYALVPILECNPHKVQVATMVDRKHKRYPIIADFVGLSLATTLKEHIVVSFAKGKEAAYLQ